MRVFIFATHEGGYLEVWLDDPDGTYYQEARETGAVQEINHARGGATFPRNVNWIASAVIDKDFDFTLQAPRETAS